MKKEYIVGIDMGGTSSKCGIFDSSGKLIKRYVIKTVYGDEKIVKYLYEETLKVVKSMGLDYEKDVKGVGMAACGPINPQGVWTNAGKMGLFNFPIKAECDKYFKKPTAILNDAVAAAFGEWKEGAGRKYSDFFLLTIGTGVGGGIISNNRILRGANNFAGHLSHGGFYQTVRECPCRLPYCMEGLSSSTGAEWYMNRIATVSTDSASSLVKLKCKLGRKLTYEDLASLVKEGDEEAISTLRFLMKPLASTISVNIFALDPQAVLIGGGFSGLGQPLIDAIRYWTDQILWEDRRENVEIKICELGNDAGLIGAVEYCMAKLRGEDV